MASVESLVNVYCLETIVLESWNPSHVFIRVWCCYRNFLATMDNNVPSAILSRVETQLGRIKLKAILKMERKPRSIRPGELETLVIGKRTFLDYVMFYAIFYSNCSGFATSSKNPWPSNFDVTFEQAIRYISLNNSDFIPSSLGPTNLSLENHFIAYVIAINLLLCVGSLSTLSQHDTLLTYSILSQHKIKLSSFIINYMIEAYLDPSNLPYWLIIARILEATNISLNSVRSVSVEQCYNSKAFGSIGYVLIDNAWVPEPKGHSIGNPSSLKSKSSSLLVESFF
ncbi:hypothetical protein FXO37_23919 [Capsicum annuum]|nr:hypothetical protein FXO37_23919 [Capsicum annuum]